jgi:hypothetical protein
VLVKPALAPHNQAKPRGTSSPPRDRRPGAQQAVGGERDRDHPQRELDHAVGQHPEQQRTQRNAEQRGRNQMAQVGPLRLAAPHADADHVHDDEDRQHHRDGVTRRDPHRHERHRQPAECTAQTRLGDPGEQDGEGGDDPAEGVHLHRAEPVLTGGRR